MRRILLALGALLLVGGAFAWWSLVPPAPLAVPERGALLEDVRVVNPGGAHLEHRSVRIEGGAIAAIDAAVGSGPWAGYTVLPGLADLHVHFPPPTGLGQTELFAFLFLMHGVTSVRDCGDVDGSASAPARDGPREGRFPGPRVFACGYFVDGPEPLWPNSIVVRSAEEARAAVRRVAAEGFDCVKVYERLSAEALAAIREEAAAQRLPVIGHLPRAVSYLEGRLDDVQHLTGIGREAGDQTPFPEVIEGLFALPDAELAALARRSAELGIANTPTRVVTERMLATRDLAAARRSPHALLLPRLYRDVIWSREGSRLLAGLDEADYERLARAQPHGQRVVRALHAAGARIYAGTDVLNPFVVPGESLQRELALFVEAGMTPEEALVTATSAPGELLGRRGLAGLGRLEPGAPADLLVFRDDPSRDLAALASLAAVVADGRLYTREALDVQLARYQAYADGWLFDRVSVAVTRRLLARLFEEEG